MKKVIATILVDEDKLKTTYYDGMDIPHEDYSFQEAFQGEMGWSEQSGISLEDWNTNVMKVAFIDELSSMDEVQSGEIPLTYAQKEKIIDEFLEDESIWMQINERLLEIIHKVVEDV